MVICHGILILLRYTEMEKEIKSDKAEPKELIVLNNRTEADHLASILKDHGIPSFIREYGLGSLYGSYFGVFGDSGIHLFVPNSAYKTAKEILITLNYQQ